MDDIYFAGSIRGGRDDVGIYLSIIEHLGKYGKVLTEHIGNKNIGSSGENLEETEIHDRDMNWISQARTIVAEVTTASLGVGYYIGRIVERNVWAPEHERKKILCLYRPQIDKKLSAMIKGCRGLTNVDYGSVEEATAAIDRFFSS